MSTISNIIGNAQTPGGVAGSLALGIIATLCWVYIRDPFSNPEIEKTLTYAFISIVGFYFGTTATKGTSTPGSQIIAPAAPATAPALAPPVVAPVAAAAQAAGGAAPVVGAAG
jgi:hypothetical protein